MRAHIDARQTVSEAVPSALHRLLLHRRDVSIWMVDVLEADTRSTAFSVLVFQFVLPGISMVFLRPLRDVARCLGTRGAADGTWHGVFGNNSFPKTSPGGLEPRSDTISRRQRRDRLLNRSLDCRPRPSSSRGDDVA